MWNWSNLKETDLTKAEDNVHASTNTDSRDNKYIQRKVKDGWWWLSEKGSLCRRYPNTSKVYPWKFSLEWKVALMIWQWWWRCISANCPMDDDDTLLAWTIEPFCINDLVHTSLIFFSHLYLCSGCEQRQLGISSIYIHIKYPEYFFESWESYGLRMFNIWVRVVIVCGLFILNKNTHSRHSKQFMSDPLNC